MDLNIGTSGYNYKFWGPCTVDKSIKTDSYYPTTNSKKWLERYARDLNSVEINCTRYNKLKPESCLNWVRQTPENFTFTIKAPLHITHYKKLNDFSEWWLSFQPCIYALGKKFKCILFQFHPNFKCSEKNIEKLKTVKKVIPVDVKCAFEFRDLAWYNPSPPVSADLMDLFTDNFCQVVLIVPEVRNQDNNFGNLPGGIHIGITNPSFIYFRFHGTFDYSCGTYAEKLDEYIAILESMRDSQKFKRETVCVYFNNTDTWTLLPFSSQEGDFSEGVPYDLAYLPSAIYDAIYMMSNLKYC